MKERHLEIGDDINFHLPKLAGKAYGYMQSQVLPNVLVLDNQRKAGGGKSNEVKYVEHVLETVRNKPDIQTNYGYLKPFGNEKNLALLVTDHPYIVQQWIKVLNEHGFSATEIPQAEEMISEEIINKIESFILNYALSAETGNRPTYGTPNNFNQSNPNNNLLRFLQSAANRSGNKGGE